ncbi:MAG: tetratricopeptide repeat protein [Oscillospiraceae bacterium]|nr:tetratricopeptide repeat protein [Oscillospiraceae bacterium]
MESNTFVSESKTAFMNGNFDKALESAIAAIEAESTNAEAYSCAANACMSLQKQDKAIEYYKEAIKNDLKNGDRYFQLGFAYASAGRSADSLKSLARAEELKCSKEVYADLYQLMGIICFDARKFDDALINFKRAEFYIGPDLDLLNRMAIIYGIKNDIKKGLFVTNQIKLLSPSNYMGYKLAFNFLTQAKRYDLAEKELMKAKKYANINMEFYLDRMSLELQLGKEKSDNEYYKKALAWISRGLKESRPSVKEIAESYINASEIYLQLQEADNVINCLNATYNPAESYNMGFSIIPETFETHTLTEYDVEEMMEEDHLRNEEMFGPDGIEELAEQIEPDEEGNRDYLTFIDEAEESSNENDGNLYKADDSEKFNLSKENVDQINRLFVGAYTLKEDFEQVIRYAKMLQGSESNYISYMGRYVEVNSLMKLGRPESAEEYDKLIRFFRKVCMTDPSDMAALTYRIQCNIDIKNYDEAEKLCGLLNNAVRQEYLNRINKERTGGE